MLDWVLDIISFELFTIIILVLTFVIGYYCWVMESTVFQKLNELEKKALEAYSEIQDRKAECKQLENIVTQLEGNLIFNEDKNNKKLGCPKEYTSGVDIH
ncbi:hypothetical protein BIT28_10235 [Photobacterium proteolyticum]|uniref:Uncharacterized protein n=1 Tax=Photobacterium proteolyticum TaxID=1903952 RepID=A0A1Q9G6L0_9GAMM|nr:hypothetical protein [Photobacterium proteolyticum]OLQ69921.1 hypothetical protein BIT28_10235 [Photobacterium proteolyticum]